MAGRNVFPFPSVPPIKWEKVKTLLKGDIRTSDDIRFHVGYHFSVHKSALLCLGSRKLGTTMETPDPAGIPPEWVANLEQALQSDPDLRVLCHCAS